MKSMYKGAIIANAIIAVLNAQAGNTWLPIISLFCVILLVTLAD